ncbi:hypothetical protein GCM10028822_17030 [Hymenobacter terrigena]
MNKLISAGLLGLLLVGSGEARAQANATHPWGTWFIGTVILPGTADHKLGGYAEAQARLNGVFSQYFYHELKAGVSYDIDPNFSVLVGGGRYVTADYQDLGAGPLNVEKRLWQQLTLTQVTKRLKLEHRYRIEQRWLAFRNDSSAFRQRLRYRLNAFYPLNKPTITAGTWFLSAYDEIFLNPKGPVFERNRVYGGFGYQPTARLILQLGFVNQANYNLPTYRAGQFIPQINSAKNNLVLALTYKLARRSAVPATEQLPSQQD